MSKPISPKPVTTIDGDGLPAYVSNGVIGLRVRAVPLERGIAVLNGLAGMHPHAFVESSPYAPYPFGADVRVNGTWLSDVPHCVEYGDQRYDFETGELHTTFRAHARDVTAEFDVLTFCSRSQPSLALQEVAVTFDGACDVSLRAVLDPGNIPGSFADRWHEMPIDQGETIDGALRWETNGAMSSCGAAFSTELRGASDVDCERPAPGATGPLCMTRMFRARRGRTYRLRQISALVPSQLHRQPDLQAARLVALGSRLGFDHLRQENRDEWAQLWQGRVNLVGAPTRWQAMADAAFFYLRSSVHPSSHASTSIFGLAQWHDYHYYYGHVMWDIETFSIPPLLLTQPDAAKTMLAFRCRGLDAAKDNARMWGFQGVQYPWEASPSRGEEVAPGAGDAASFEHHVSMAVAHALASYVYATGNENFLRLDAWPALVGISEWIASRVTKSPRGYEIRRAMGIAEREEPSDNVAFVNMAATVALRDTLRCGRQLGYAPTGPWQEIADNLVVPIDKRRRVILDHDDFTPKEEKGATPAALAGLFPYGYEVDPEVERATIEYYLDIADDYIGSPMLSSLYGVWATRIGDRERAADLLEEGYAKFVNDRFMNTHEYRHDKFPDQPIAGPFFANLSGFLLGCMYGFPALSLDDGDPTAWGKREVVLPTGWEGIAIDRIWARRRPARLEASHGDGRATIEFLDERRTGSTTALTSRSACDSQP